MALLSPGVEIIEIDASTIAPTVSNSIACFAGNFDKGPVGTYLLISNEADLVTFYGKPTIKNYNDWMQVSSFLKYGDKCFVARAANTNGSTEEVSGVTITADVTDDKVLVSSVAEFKVGQLIAFGTDEGVVLKPYRIMAIDVANLQLTLDREATVDILLDAHVYMFSQSINSVFEATTDNTVVTNYLEYQVNVGNYADFEDMETSIAFTSTKSKLKLIAKNQGNWGNGIEVAIAVPADFNHNKYVFEGIALDDLFEYFPTNDEYGIIVRLDGEIQEVFTVSFDVDAKNNLNKSIYIESVINQQSSLLFCKDNTANDAPLKSYIHSTNGVIKLVDGADSDMGIDDLMNAYALWENKEEVDVDIVIANELDGGMSAKSLVDTRLDCIAFIGANYADCVGKKATIAISNLVAWRNGSLNFNNMFCVACANYVYMYNKYLDKNVWVNVAGHIAGLRAQTSTARASWWASAGLERGQIKNILKLAFNPNNAQRDILYKNGLNPIVSFAGQGIVMWGQKTLLDKASSSNIIALSELIAA